MTRKKVLTAAERKLTALQRAALERLYIRGDDELAGFAAVTIASLLMRKAIDRIGRARASRVRYVITDKGRTVLAYRAAHTGTAKR